MIARGHIDEVRFVDPLARNVDLAGNRRIPENSSVYLRGWAFLADPPRTASAAGAAIDDGEPMRLAYNQARPDVIKALGLDTSLPIGFHGVLSLSGLACGPHVLRVALVDEAGATAPIEATISFEVVDGKLAFPATQRLERGEMTVAVDVFTSLGNRDGSATCDGPVARGTVLTIRGWAVDRRFTTAASDVYACLDRSTFVRGIIGTLRGDVAGSLGMQSVARCGYVVRIDTGSLALGEHVLEVRAIAADGERYAASESLSFSLV